MGSAICVLFSNQRHPEGVPSQVLLPGETPNGELVLLPGQGPGSLGPWVLYPQRRRKKRRISTCWWERGRLWTATWTWVLTFVLALLFFIFSRPSIYIAQVHTASTPNDSCKTFFSNHSGLVMSHKLIWWFLLVSERVKVFFSFS